MSSVLGSCSHSLLVHGRIFMHGKPLMISKGMACSSTVIAHCCNVAHHAGSVPHDVPMMFHLSRGMNSLYFPKDHMLKRNEINPTAYSGQDQDPSNETIVVSQVQLQRGTQTSLRLFSQAINRLAKELQK